MNEDGVRGNSRERGGEGGDSCTGREPVFGYRNLQRHSHREGGEGGKTDDDDDVCGAFRALGYFPAFTPNVDR